MGHEIQDLRIIQAGRGGSASVQLVRHGNDLAVLKGFAQSRPWFRKTIGSYLISREAAAYTRLVGVSGVPRVLARLAPDMLLIEYLEARSCLDVDSSDFSADFFRELRQILNSIRAKGVLHCDVARNVLFSSSRRPMICDFASSIILPVRPFPARQAILRLREQYDNRSVLKLKRRVASHLLTEEDLLVLATPLPFERYLFQPLERLLRTCTRLLERLD